MAMKGTEVSLAQRLHREVLVTLTSQKEVKLENWKKLVGKNKSVCQ